MVKVNNSYYTAYPNLHSYATVSDNNACAPAGNGLVRYPVGGTKYGTGKTCPDARIAYQRAYGKIPVSKPGTGATNADRTGLNPPSKDNTPSTSEKQNAALLDQKKNSVFSNLPTPTIPNINLTKTPGSDDSVNPDSGCHNCGDDWWNPAQWGCVVFAKPSCEIQSAVGKGWSGVGDFFSKYGLYILGGGAAIIAIVILLMKR